MATNTNADIGSSPYARRRRELFELIKALRDLGADADLGRPRIAVIGGQSAGKSSLVEAVTGITVPRDSGTCTRCPMECSIRGGTSSWSCQISLMRANGIDGPRSVITTPFGERIADKGDVEISIRRAQAAILSPHRPADAFLNKTYDELKEMLEQDTRTRSFSKDVVVVDIEDPDGTDLLFVDLPGLVQNANDSDIETVKGLVEEYIAEEKTIILVTIPASDDLENQQAIKLARQADPEGSRTVGVVTKPDALTAGATSARNKWQNILKGLDHKHALVLGYYCIRLPDDEERGKTRAEMQLIANEFLRTTQPWSGLHNTDRLGVPALVRDISDLLMGIIEESLPEILKKLQDRIRKCEDDLAALPEPVRGDPATEILNRTTAFCQDLQAIVAGTSEDKSFVHRNRAVYLKFVLAIRRTAPNFQPYESLYHYRMRHFGDEQETVEQLVMPPMDLYEVRRVIQDSIAWELPRNIPYDAKVVLIKKFLELWPEPSLHCQIELYDIVREVVDTQITQHFKRFKRLENHIGPLVRNHAASVFEACTVAVNELVERESSLLFTQNNHYLDSVYWKWLNRYKCARRNPLNRSFTLPYSSHVAEGTESVLDADDLSCPGSPCPEMSVPGPTYLYHASQLASGSYREEATRKRTPTEKALDALSAAGYASLTEADLARLHPPDAFEDEIGVMADVRAYFQVAYKRIIDHFPLTIQHAISQKLVKTMQAHLVDKLKLGAPDASQRFKDLLVEDPQLEVKREELLEQMKQLKDIRERVEQI